MVATRFDPLRIIEWVVALSTAIGGIYVISPLYDISVDLHGLSAFAQALSSTAMISLWGTVLLIGAILAIVGIVTKRDEVKSAGWFALVLARFFQLLTTWLTVGILPISWIHPFTVMMIAVVLWFWARYEVHKNNGGN